MINGIQSAIVAPSLDIEPIAPVGSESAGGSSEFAQILGKAMDATESLQSNAEQQVSGLVNGAGVDVHSATIAIEKADLSFQLMMQVRNKVVQAYQEISHMAF
jgi:flagellar hook-basal body complex protein FliE